MKITIQVIVCFALAHITATLVRRHFRLPLKNEPWRADWRARQIEWWGKRYLTFWPTFWIAVFAYLAIWTAIEVFIQHSN